MNELHTEVLKHISKRNHLGGMDVWGSEAGIMLVNSTEFWTLMLFLNTTLHAKEVVEAHFLTHEKARITWYQN